MNDLLQNHRPRFKARFFIGQPFPVKTIGVSTS